MQPAADIFTPFFFPAPNAPAPSQPGAPAPSDKINLRAARFAADPAVPARGLCVLLGGQTEFIEKYFEVIDELRGRGFAVATLDWRGQGGSARAQTGDSRKGYVKDFAEYDDDLAAFMAQVAVPEAGHPTIALAHSMGGHILLRYLLKQPQAFSRAVLSAPMIAVSFRGTAAWLVHLVTRAEIWRGNGAGWVWGIAVRDPHDLTFATQIVTSDRERFERTQAILRAHPALRLAGATWAWLGAALRSMAWLRRQAERIATPLLVIGAGADRIVLTDRTRTFAARLPQARYIEIAGAGHEMLMERDAIRAQWWAAFDRFTGAHCPAP